MLKKLIVILGPTAAGKSEMAVKIAKKFNGEIVSVDSRQVYKGMDIGTGKISKKEMKGIPHYLLDVVSPKRKFTVAQYQKLALKAIKKIQLKKKIPIICGGTGFYIQAVVDGIVIPEVKPDWKLRLKLEKLTTEELFKKLKKLDPRRAKTIEKKNPRRLIRAIEIVTKTGEPVPLLKFAWAHSHTQAEPEGRSEVAPFACLMIGIKKEKKELSSLIRRRLLKRLGKGMVAEVKKLKKSGLSWKRLEEFGLEYRYIAQYLQRKINYDEMIQSIQKESERLAKRQMTWFKRDERINWVKTYQKTEKLVKNFLKQKSSFRGALPAKKN